MLKQLQAEGVDTEYRVRDDKAATGAAVIQVAESGEKQIFAASNANANLSLEDIRRAEAIKNTQMLVTQLEVPLETVLEVARLGHEAGAKIILDPAPPREIPDELLKRLHVIKPNSSAPAI